MSEQRFRVCCDDDLGDMWVIDIDTDEEYWTAPSLVDLLNSLSKENEQLKQELNECANHKLYSRRKLEKENKELKQQLDKIPENIRKVWLE